MAGCNMRIGQGYDVHRLVPQRKLILGGVEIPLSRGCWATSDADVIVHAVMDALLGLRDSGTSAMRFPTMIRRRRGFPAWCCWVGSGIC